MKKNFCSLGHVQMALGFTLLVSSVAIGQVCVITDIVTENNKPVQGVSISQQWSDQLVMTGSSGKYQLEVKGGNPVLIFRYSGYGQESVEVDDRTVVDLALGREKQIEEVVLNAGYYKVREKESTGSIAKVSAKDIGGQPVTNVLSTVQGRMAGVSITQNSGLPGGGYDIQIRGKNSLRNKNNSEIDGNQPLYVVDGIPLGGEINSQYSSLVMPGRGINLLNSINPQDIESIEVLKDADATAIYGSRGGKRSGTGHDQKREDGKAVSEFFVSIWAEPGSFAYEDDGN